MASCARTLSSKVIGRADAGRCDRSSAKGTATDNPSGRLLMRAPLLIATMRALESACGPYRVTSTPNGGECQVTDWRTSGLGGLTFSIAAREDRGSLPGS